MEIVDVVIPTYQETERLFRAVESVKAQTLKVNKVFIVEDGSSENVRNEIKTKYLSDKQIEVILNNHTGLPGAGRKVGIEKSKADWIAFLDADDTWASEKIKKQLSAARDSGADLIFSNAGIVVNGSHQGSFFSAERFQTQPSVKKLIADNRIVNSSVMVRRAALLDVGVYADSSHVRGVEDYATWLRLRVNHRFLGLDEELVQFEVSQNGIGLSSNPMVRIFALADFVAWSRGSGTLDSRQLGRARKSALAQILRENK